MSTQSVPLEFPLDVIDPSVSVRTAIDNGRPVAARAVEPLERAAWFLHAGLEHVLAGGVKAFTFTTTAAQTVSLKVRCPPFGGEVEVALRMSLTGAADGDYVEVQLTTDNDGTGQTVLVAPAASTDVEDSSRVLLRADLGDGTKSAESNGETVALTFTLNNSGGTVRVWGAVPRIIPRRRIAL